MKRCQSKGTKILVLVLTSLFIFLGCGIPTYINLDNDITWTQDNTTSVSDSILSWSIGFSARGKEKLDTMVDQGPGIKLFYTVSPDPSNTVFGSATVPIESRFNTYFKSLSGNGLEWSAGLASAPGFYLFTRASSSTGNPFSLSRLSATEVNAQSPMVVVGTFSMGDSAGTGYAFHDGPTMDIPVTSATVVLKFEKSSLSAPEEGYATICMTVDSTEYLLRNYYDKPFAVTNQGALNIVGEDADYFTYITDGNYAPVYIHIWASLFGGRGDFSNTYWSSLEYLGRIRLIPGT